MEVLAECVSLPSKNQILGRYQVLLGEKQRKKNFNNRRKVYGRNSSVFNSQAAKQS